ncbi:MAG: Flp pilus assembly protein CpaB [Bacillota bacterium]
MNPRRYLLLALASALLAAGLSFDILARADRTAPVIVAATGMSRLQMVRTEDVKVVNLPVRALHPQAAARREEVVGKYSLSDVVPGEQVLKSKLSGEEKDGTFLSRLAPNQRAFFVPLSLARAAGGAVRTGDRIDLIFVASEQKTGLSYSRTVAQGLEVLDVRNERGTSTREGPSDALPTGVVVAVTGAQAELIALAAENGQLYLAVNGYGAAGTGGPGAGQEDLAGP